MGNKVLKFRTVNSDVFTAILDGSKKIETRAATPKYRDVKVGDILVLTCGRKRIEKRVVKVELFKTIGALLKIYQPEEINPKICSSKEAREMWYSFPGYKEKIKKFGLVAWNLQ